MPVSELDIPAEIAAEMQARGAQVIDVREDYEREAGYIPGSRHIQLGALASEASTIDRDRPVILQCRIGGRSAMATDALRAEGYDAYNLSGGLLAWVAGGLPLEPQDGYVADH
jgi:rhodanese-related sulfurtransferase